MPSSTQEEAQARLDAWLTEEVGGRLALPLQPDGEPFIYWTEFRAAAGFVKGINVLEVEVLNAGPFSPPSLRHTAKSRMSCRVELEGEVCRDPGLGGGDPSDKAPQPDRETKKTPASRRTNFQIRPRAADGFGELFYNQLQRASYFGPLS